MDWQQVGALARTGSPVFFGIRDKSPNVKKMARTGGTKKQAPMKFTDLKILIVFFLDVQLQMFSPKRKQL